MKSVFIKLTGNEDRHKISDEFEFRSYLTIRISVVSDQSFWSYVPLSGVKKNDVFSFSQWTFVKLADNADRHKSSNEFEFGPNRIIHFGIICL